MIYSKEIVEIITSLIIEGYDLRQIGKVKGLPSKATICRWLTDERKIYFLDKYRAAKEIQHYMVCDELMELSQRYHYTALGAFAGRIHKLHPKTNLRPRTAIHAEIERRARLKYCEE